jgi:hypothetical protein
MSRALSPVVGAKEICKKTVQIEDFEDFETFKKRS